MPSFRIPKAHHKGLAKLLALDEASKQRLLAALIDITLAAKPADLSKRVSSSADIPLEIVSEFLTVLISLCSLRTYLNLQPAEIADQVCEAMVESGDPDLKLDADNRNEFSGYLKELLDTRSLTVSSKVVDIWSEHEHPFCSVRIFTDLRPVFGVEAGTSNNVLLATGTVHMLKLSYHQQESIREIYIAMDDEDIGKLSGAIDEARTKSESLRATLKEAKITYFD